MGTSSAGFPVSENLPSQHKVDVHLLHLNLLLLSVESRIVL